MEGFVVPPSDVPSPSSTRRRRRLYWQWGIPRVCLESGDVAAQGARKRMNHHWRSIVSAPVREARRFSPWGRLSPWWSRTKSYEAIRGRSSITNLLIQQYNNTITTTIPVQLQQQQPTTTYSTFDRSEKTFRGNKGATPSRLNLF